LHLGVAEIAEWEAMDWTTEESVFDFWQEEGILSSLKVTDRL
jgi:hypothetical protein